jgi:hypothetical protein
MFADEFLPVYDVSDEVATVVAADPLAVGEALLAADPIEVGKRTPVAGLLGALRVLPELVSHLLHGERPGEELALGLAGSFWRPVIEYAHVPADRFRDFGEPRRWFRRYWTFGVGSGAHILVHALLEMIRQTAEDAPTAEAEQAR